MKPTLIIALHGTRSHAGSVQAEALRAEVASVMPGVRVELGWVDIHDELLAQTVQRVGACVVVPVFLAAGYHVSHDVPAAIRASGGLAVATDHVGGDLVSAIRDRLLAAAPLGDGVLLAAIGSKRPGAHAEVLANAQRLESLVGRPVVAGFIYAASPTPAEALAELRRRGCSDVTVAVHALVPGLYRSHLEHLDVRAVAEPIGNHPMLIDAVVRRYHAAALPLAA